MSCWIAIPIKKLSACKTRLRSALEDGEREQLVCSMLNHVMAIADGAAGDNKRLLIAPSGHDVSAMFERVPDKARGLNGELAGLLEAATASGADRLVIVPADLPLIAEADMEALVALPHGHAAIAPDRARLGTNALSLPLPAARDFQFQFGRGSFSHHCAEAARHSLPFTIIRSDSLALDIDEPADLMDLRARHPGAYWLRGRHLETGGAIGSK